jgi:hypothetical protein
MVAQKILAFLVSVRFRMGVLIKFTDYE